MHLPGERQLQHTLGDPSSHSLCGNTNRGCFWSISFLACSCLIGPLFPWDHLYFFCAVQRRFRSDISLTLPSHCSSSHFCSLKRGEPHGLCCSPGSPQQAAQPHGAQHHSRPGSMEQSWQPSSLLPALPVPGALHREALARHKTVDLEQCNAGTASAGELSRAWLWIITAT